MIEELKYNDVVVGHIIRKPETQWKIKNVKFIPETEAGGKTVCYCYAPSIVGFRLAWPYIVNGHIQFPHGATNYGMITEHIISNKYFPPELGPLALYIEGANQNIVDSDLLGGIGLLNGTHCSYHVEFIKRNDEQTAKADEIELLKDSIIKIYNIAKKVMNDLNIKA